MQLFTILTSLLLHPTFIAGMTVPSTSRWVMAIATITCIPHLTHGQSEPLQNVLLIIVDDLKPSLGAFGDIYAKTPNLDKLSNRGLKLENHHVQVSECAPSRVSMFTGLRPDRIKTFSREGAFRIRNPRTWTMPGWLRSKGYNTFAIGKVFDWPAFSLNPAWETKPLEVCHNTEHTQQGSMGCSFDDHITPYAARADPCRCPAHPMSYPGLHGKVTPLIYGLDKPQYTDENYIDTCLATQGIYHLKRLALLNQPFFLAMGFMRPHLPWSAPKTYWDMFSDYTDMASAVLNAGLAYSFFQTDSQMASYYNSQEILDYIGWTGSSLDVDFHTRVRAYYASAAYVDVQVGRLIDALDESSVSDNTIVILWGDNGYHLGSGVWCKKTVFEDGTRTPLVVIPSARWRARNSRTAPGLNGGSSLVPVETIDIFPTVLDLLGFSADINTLSLSGTSLVPLFWNTNAFLKQAAMSQYHSWTDPVNAMGYTLRTDRMRIIIYFNFDGTCWRRGVQCQLYNTEYPTTKIELYDLGQPGFLVAESTNVYRDGNYRQVLNMLQGYLDTRTPTMDMLKQVPQPTSPPQPKPPPSRFPTYYRGGGGGGGGGRPTSPPAPVTPSSNCHSKIYADCIAQPGCVWIKKYYYGIACQPAKTSAPTNEPTTLAPTTRSPTLQPIPPTPPRPTVQPTHQPSDSPTIVAPPTTKKRCSLAQYRPDCLSYGCAWVSNGFTWACKAPGNGGGGGGGGGGGKPSKPPVQPPTPQLKYPCIDPGATNGPTTPPIPTRRPISPTMPPTPPTMKPVPVPTTHKPTTLAPVPTFPPTNNPTIANGVKCSIFNTPKECLRSGCSWVRLTALSGYVCVAPGVNSQSTGSSTSTGMPSIEHTGEPTTTTITKPPTVPIVTTTHSPNSDLYEYENA